MQRRLNLAAGIIALAAATVVPAGPAHADSFRDDQWYLRTLKVTQAHAISEGAGVTVAVVDSGVYPHPDIQHNLLRGINEITGASDGRVDSVGHGTNMAAIIAAHGRNSRDGVLGIAPSAKILPVKISNDANNVPSQIMATGIVWASQHGAKVINVSAVTGPAFELDDAVSSAIKADTVIVAGVGNTSKSLLIGYPAAIDGVLAVGAVDRNNKPAGFSIKDPKVQICAPGVSITTAQPKDKYSDVDGTSPATAIVSGAAALVRAKFPRLSAPEVIHRLTATADDIGPPGRDKECGFGVLNIVKALTANVPPLESTASASPSATTTTPAAATPGPTGSTNAQPASSNTPVVLGGVVFGLALVGALLYLARRRRGTG